MSYLRHTPSNPKIRSYLLKCGDKMSHSLSKDLVFISDVVLKDVKVSFDICAFIMNGNENNKYSYTDNVTGL